MINRIIDSIAPCLIYVPFVSSISGIYKLLSNREEAVVEDLSERKIVHIDSHELAKTFVAIFPFIGNFIVIVMDMAETIFSKDAPIPEETEESVSKIEVYERITALKQEHKKELDKLNNEKNELEKRNQEVEKEISDLRIRITTTNGLSVEVIKTLESKHKELSEEMRAQKAKLESSESRIKALEDANSAKSTKKESKLQNRLSEIDERLKIAEEEKKAVNLALEKSKKEEVKKTVEPKLDEPLKSKQDAEKNKKIAAEVEANRLKTEKILKEDLVRKKKENDLIKKASLLLDNRLFSTRNLVVDELKDSLCELNDAYNVIKDLLVDIKDSAIIKDIETRKAQLSKYRNEIELALSDELIIEAGDDDDIVERISELSPSFPTFATAAALKVAFDDPLRVKVLKNAYVTPPTKPGSMPAKVEEQYGLGLFD